MIEQMPRIAKDSELFLVEVLDDGNRATLGKCVDHWSDLFYFNRLDKEVNCCDKIQVCCQPRIERLAQVIFPASHRER